MSTDSINCSKAKLLTGAAPSLEEMNFGAQKPVVIASFVTHLMTEDPSWSCFPTSPDPSSPRTPIPPLPSELIQPSYSVPPPPATSHPGRKCHCPAIAPAHCTHCGEGPDKHDSVFASHRHQHCHHHHYCCVSDTVY